MKSCEYKHKWLLADGKILAIATRPMASLSFCQYLGSEGSRANEASKYLYVLDITYQFRPNEMEQNPLQVGIA